MDQSIKELADRVLLIGFDDSAQIIHSEVNNALRRTGWGSFTLKNPRYRKSGIQTLVAFIFDKNGKLYVQLDNAPPVPKKNK
jgi:hypothetical protein